tara:strand:- start:397 stop:915 length:519 start_codon:yes stop_codon:yes gene_type:complete
MANLSLSGLTKRYFPSLGQNNYKLLIEAKIVESMPRDLEIKINTGSYTSKFKLNTWSIEFNFFEKSSLDENFFNLIYFDSPIARCWIYETREKILNLINFFDVNSKRDFRISFSTNVRVHQDEIKFDLDRYTPKELDGKPFIDYIYEDKTYSKKEVFKLDDYEFFEPYKRPN